jgi:hypothetical protein
MYFKRIILSVCAAIIGIYSTANVSAAELVQIGPSRCSSQEHCGQVDAIVFVHGIYGDTDTFINAETQFNWPEKFPRRLGNRSIDVFQLKYGNEIAGWAKQSNPSFEELSDSVLTALKPLRQKNYRTIGFIAHSLGGNVISTYVHRLKTKFGHPQRSQNAFIITLATPVLGSQWADRAGWLKSFLGMNDDLLASLENENLFLRMLSEFRQDETQKERRYVCRPVNLHAAYEKEYLGPILVVSTDSAALPISNIVSSPIVGFGVDHSQIAKPKDEQDKIFKWVQDRVENEYLRVATWEAAHKDAPPSRRLCELMDLIPEGP